MTTRRELLKSTLAAAAFATVAQTPLGHAFAATGNSLGWQHFPAGPNGFYRAPVLLTGATETLLIDGGFSYPDGAAIVDAISKSGKKLTTIYISQSDPDYYFSLKPIHEAFPDAKVIASSETIAAIKGNIEKKLAVWGPKLGENGPQTMDDIVMPDVFDGDTLTVDGETVEIITVDSMKNRRYLWVPSLGAIFGGVLIFSGVHVWTADTPTTAIRQEWIEILDKLATRNPKTVVPGHMTADSTTDIGGILHTKNYLIAFDEELPKAANAAELKAAMEARFPNLGMGIALDIGSKVATGEMTWG
ncbi:MBL fold metallo-hydrolase [Thalassospira australica]|uniref:MBL fold metallo-hydrolase n=1 Tax=Thalassospira australica TaxID=1528106 RepID=UPI00051A0286|nr:MBL fold metallo-hydrolase [Thalassospira australica]